jgi:hypothetical protein
MPTGYTASIADGTTTELRDYALSCARAFGALVMLRDEPIDSPVTDEAFKPNTGYHDTALAAAVELAVRLRTITDAECDAEAAREYTEAMARHQKWVDEIATTRERYDAMRIKVDAWTPPTPDHANFKAFMHSQIADSARHDCRIPDLPVAKTGAQWRDAAYEKVARDIDYHAKERRKEIERCAERKAWWLALVGSV